MRQKAKMELHRKGTIKTSEPQIPEKPPSFISGFSLMFLGTFATIILFGLNQILWGIILGGPFVIIGSFRINKATMYRSKRRINN